MEVKKEVKTFEVNYKCDECDDGYMQFDGIVLTSYPAQYPHSCDNKDCDATKTFRGESYPKMVHEKISSPDKNGWVTYSNETL